MKAGAAYQCGEIVEWQWHWHQLTTASISDSPLSAAHPNPPPPPTAQLLFFQLTHSFFTIFFHELIANSKECTL